MKSKVSSFIVVLIAFVLISCGGQSWRQTAVTGYETEQVVIKDCYNTYQDLKTKGFVTPDAEKMWNTLYPQVKKAHELAGDTLSLAIKAESTLEYKDGLSSNSSETNSMKYFKLFTQYSGEALKLAKELKTFVEGLKK